ncbi:hypothetical protein PJO24_004928 [Salmonella enterica]|nr:hypothetical protein [Salmonella enterica]
MSVRALAKRVGRLYCAVYRDVQVLSEAGVIGFDDKGKLIFPYDAVRFSFSVGVTRSPVNGGAAALQNGI